MALYSTHAVHSRARACLGIALARSVHRMHLCACVARHLDRRPVAAEKHSGTRRFLSTASK
eukprot:6475297-Alexandrium_andersonii.AAC.1